MWLKFAISQFEMIKRMILNHIHLLSFNDLMIPY